MINYTAGAGRGMMPKSCQLITASLYQTIWVLVWGRVWKRILRRRQMLLMFLCVYEKLVVYAMIKKGKIYALRNFFLLSFPPLAFAAHAWWNYKENLCLINFSLPLIYDFRFALREGFELILNDSCWVLLGARLEWDFPHEIFRFDPRKYVTNFTRFTPFSWNCSLFSPLQAIIKLS